ncbi:hypothetical protein GCM10007199_10760 [Fictibacillus barbaricus]|nr:hypothetical protein GCM10007199_10760 [Fictibacillus barbaricus]
MIETTLKHVFTRHLISKGDETVSHITLELFAEEKTETVQISSASPL